MTDETLRFPALGSGLRWLSIALISVGSLGFVALVGVFVALAVRGRSGSAPDDLAMSMMFGAVGFLLLGLYGQMIVAPIWLYHAWSWLPPDQRYSSYWKSWISPGQAAWFLVIPYFQYYWMFVINCGLCDALDRLRARYPTNALAPKTLAITASVCQLIIPFPVGMVLWIVFMAKIEGMTREMARG